MQQKKYIFQILHKEIKLAPKVLAFADDTNENSIDIYIGEDRPDKMCIRDRFIWIESGRVYCYRN